jgi:predicted HAD superfamily Cof-like phosphohydrolase
MNDLIAQGKEFRKVYGCLDGKAHRNLQKTLIDEEWSEFHEAFHFESEEEQLKELGDLVYVCIQYSLSQGWDLNEAMDRIHKSNMSKLGPDGKPVKRFDGKLIKGPNYQPPDLSDLVNKSEEDESYPIKDHIILTKAHNFE